MKHPQHDLLIAIANGEQLQWERSDGTWIDMEVGSALHMLANSANPTLRIKPATITVNGIEVPEPMQEAPKHGVVYWFPCLTNTPLADCNQWDGDNNDARYLQRGLCHTTESAAIAHAKAMLAPSMKEQE